MSQLLMRLRRGVVGAGVLVLAASLLVVAPGLDGTAAAAAGCVSTADCLSKMTLAEKAGQMTQVANSYLSNKNDIATYGLGSVLSGGGGGPNGAGGTATQWADMVDDYQSYALRSRLGIPLLYGVDAVHGHNNVQGAVIFPHNIALGASRDANLVGQEADVTRQEVLGTGIRWTFAPCVCVPRDDRWGRTRASSSATGPASSSYPTPPTPTRWRTPLTRASIWSWCRTTTSAPSTRS
jgi:beta-glucosidase